MEDWIRIILDSSRVASALQSSSLATRTSDGFVFVWADKSHFSSFHWITGFFSGTMKLGCTCKLAAVESELSLYGEEDDSEMAVLLNTLCVADLFRKLHPRWSLETLLCQYIKRLNNMNYGDTKLCIYDRNHDMVFVLQTYAQQLLLRPLPLQ